MIDGCRRRLPI